MNKMLCLWMCMGMALAQDPVARSRTYDGPNMRLERASVTHVAEWNLMVFEVNVAGTAGGTIPEPAGQLDGAPVLGYVFPTNLKSTDVGFGEVDGIVALAVTSHPDFDDTPLWDEDNNRNYGDDGAVFHTHWVVLGTDRRVPGGLAVQQIAKTAMAELLPPTNPGMPMLMDSPGFDVTTNASRLRVMVPVQRISGRTEFRYDAVSAYMEVSTSGEQPMLGVYAVYSVLSGDLSLPYQVTQQ